jgi:hypothetical protein
MAVIKSEVQTPVALATTATSLSTLGINTYLVSTNIGHVTNDPLDVLIDVQINTTNAITTGNKQLVIFAQASLDGTNFTSGPTTGNTATDEADLYFVGVLPVNQAGTHRKIFSLAAAYGGTLPHTSRLVFKNDIGVAITNTTAAIVQYSEVWGLAF